MLEEGYSKSLQKALAGLKRAGLKITKSRRAVLECLCATDKPMTPKGIWETLAARKEAPIAIDQASIYRILESFHKIDLIHEIHAGKGFLLCFHRQCGDVSHLLTHCLACNTSIETGIPEEMIQPLMWYLNKQLHFTPAGHYLQINGYCQACASTTSGEGG